MDIPTPDTLFIPLSTHALYKGISSNVYDVKTKQNKNKNKNKSNQNKIDLANLYSKEPPMVFNDNYNVIKNAKAKLAATNWAY